MSARPLERGPSPRAALLALALLASSVGVGNHELWTPDEPRDAAIGLEMWRSRSWWVPRLAGVPFMEKPPLYWWVQGAAFSVLGVSAGAARVPSAVLGLGSVWLTYALARRFFSRDLSALSGLVLLSTWSFVRDSHWIRVDSALLFGVTGSLAAFAHGERAFGAARVLLFLAMGVFFALSFLAKGLIGIGMPLLAIGCWVLWRRRMGALAGPLALGAALTALAAALWLWGVERKVGADAVRQFLLHNQIARFFPGSFAYAGGHERPLHYYFLEAPVQLLPWTPILLLASLAARSRWRVLEPAERDGLALCACLVLPVLAVLSLAGTKRGVYLLPLAPAAAIATSWWLANPAPRTSVQRCIERGWRWAMLVLAALLPLVPMALGASPAWALAAVGLAVLALRSERADPVGVRIWLRAVVLLNAAWICLLVAGPPALDRFKNLEPLARGIVGALPAGQVLHVLRPSETLRGVLVFYADESIRPVRDLVALSELARQEPGAWVVVEMRHNDAELARLRDAAIPFTLHRTVRAAGRSAWIVQLHGASG